MRIVCPNCAAQYEVDAKVIPPQGRDVQCSNCATTWFVPAPVHIEKKPRKPARPAPSVRKDPITTKPETPSAPSAPAAPSPAPSPKPKLDEMTRAILTEEAAHEQQARQRDLETLESQPDLGLDQAPPIAPRTAPAWKDPEQEKLQIQLPMIRDYRRQRRRGFRWAFWPIFLVVLIALLVYLFSENIKTLVPSIASPIDQYVAWVESSLSVIQETAREWRAWLTEAAKTVLPEQSDALGSDNAPDIVEDPLPPEQTTEPVPGAQPSPEPLDSVSSEVQDPSQPEPVE